MLINQLERQNLEDELAATSASITRMEKNNITVSSDSPVIIVL
jgi:hypothetical protein